MTPIKKSIIGFLLLCIPVRLLFVYIAKSINKKYLPYLGYLALFPTIGFAYLYIFNTRKVGAFNQKIWWSNLRPMHSILYFIFAYLAITKNDRAYIPLLIDVTIGFISFFIYHYNADSFK